MPHPPSPSPGQWGSSSHGWRVPLGQLAAAVAHSRVYTGVHHPGDVLVGAALGATVAPATARLSATKDVAATARAVRERRTVAMDLGDIDGRPYLNAAGIGVYPYMVAERERLEDRIGRWPAMAYALFRALRSGQPFELEIDGRRRRMWSLLVGNGRFLGKSMAPT